MVSDTEIGERFSHHPPTSEEIIGAHKLIRENLEEVALSMNAILPEGREKALVFTKLEEAMFWANAAVARVQRVGP